jgi:hypothetical protein
MRSLLRAILAGGLGFAVSLVIAACGGGSGLLSSDQSSTLSSQLTRISSALASGNCAAAADAARGLNGAVNALPPTVNVTLRNNLFQGASTVAELAQRDCREKTSTPSVTTPQQTVSTSATAPAPTTTQSSTATTTAPPTTTTSSTTPATTPTTSGTTPTGGTGGAGLNGAGSTGGAVNGGPALNTPGGTAGNGK